MVGAEGGPFTENPAPLAPPPDRIELIAPTDEADQRAFAWDLAFHAPWSRTWLVLVIAVAASAFLVVRERWGAIGMILTVVSLIAAQIVATRWTRRRHPPIPPTGSAVVPGGVEVALARTRLWWPTATIVRWAVVRRALTFQFGVGTWQFDARPLGTDAARAVAELLDRPPAPHESSDVPAAEWTTSPSYARAQMHAVHRADPAIWFNRLLLVSVLFVGFFTSSMITAATERSRAQTRIDHVGLPQTVVETLVITTLVTVVAVAAYTFLVWWSIGRRAKGEVLRLRLHDGALTVSGAAGDVVLVPYDAIELIDARRGNLALVTVEGLVVLVPESAFRPPAREVLLDAVAASRAPR